MRQHRAVSGHGGLRAGRNRAFEISIVRLVGKDCQRFGWLDELIQLGEKDGNARERFAIMGKLPGKNGEELVENGSGRASESSPSTILRSASSPRAPGSVRADTSTFVSTAGLRLPL